jgi:hypothetical protein
MQKDNIKILVREIFCEYVDWTEETQDKNPLRDMFWRCVLMLWL